MMYTKTHTISNTHTHTPPLSFSLCHFLSLPHSFFFFFPILYAHTHPLSLSFSRTGHTLPSIHTGATFYMLSFNGSQSWRSVSPWNSPGQNHGNCLIFVVYVLYIFFPPFSSSIYFFCVLFVLFFISFVFSFYLLLFIN